MLFYVIFSVLFVFFMLNLTFLQELACEIMQFFLFRRAIVFLLSCVPVNEKTCYRFVLCSG